MHTLLEYKCASPSDAEECIALRGLTHQNPISALQLAQLGITVESLRESIQSNEQLGLLCFSKKRLIGYCFGDRKTGEIVVLALLPEFENKGIGKNLLHLVVKDLHKSGHITLFLSCSARPESRSYGFYRHLGWYTTNRYDSNGDEILQYHLPPSSDA